MVTPSIYINFVNQSIVIIFNFHTELELYINTNSTICLRNFKLRLMFDEAIRDNLKIVFDNFCTLLQLLFQKTIYLTKVYFVYFTKSPIELFYNFDILK